MKNNEIKKGYEDIQISAAEKAKIYNKIMEEKNKKNVWLPVLGFGAVALASFGVLLLNNKDNNYNTNYSLNSSMNLETNYRKEVMLNAKDYLKANNIDIEKLNDGESTEIDATKVVSGDVYKSCKGKLVITKFAEDYTYSTNVTCDSSSGMDVDFKILDGELQDVYSVKDGIIVASVFNKEKILDGKYKNSVALTMFDADGNIKWNSKVMGLNNSQLGLAGLRVTEFVEVGNYYIGITENDYYYDVNSDTDYKQNIVYSYFVLKKDGTVALDSEVGFAEGSGTVGEFIGTKGNVAYFRGYTKPLETETNGDEYALSERECLYAINDVSFDIIRVSEKFNHLRKDTVVNVNDMIVMNGYVYGNVVTESTSGIKSYLYKMSLSGNLLDIIEVKYDGKDGLISTVKASSDKLYLVYRVKEDIKILKYNSKLEYLGEVEYNKEVNSDRLYFVESIEVVDDILNIHLSTEGSLDQLDNFTIRYDNDGKVIDKAEVEYNKDVTERFKCSMLYRTNIVDGKVVQVYTTADQENGITFDDQVLLVYYK